MSEDRSFFIGGSDAPSVLGLSPYRTRLDLYYSKTTPPAEDETERNTVAKKRGKRLEPYICDMLEAEHGLKLVARNQRYYDRQFSFLAAEIDAETPSENGIELDNVEIKTVHPFRARHSQQVVDAWVSGRVYER